MQINVKYNELTVAIPRSNSRSRLSKRNMATSESKERDRFNIMHTFSLDFSGKKGRSLRRCQSATQYSPYLSPGLHYNNKKKQYVLVGQHTGLKARKINRISHHFTKVSKDELLCFFRRPPISNSKHIASRLAAPSTMDRNKIIVNPKKEDGIKLKKIKTEHCKNQKEQDSPSIVVTGTNRQSNLIGWQHEHSSTHLTFSNPSSQTRQKLHLSPRQIRVNRSEPPSEPSPRYRNDVSTMKSSDPSSCIQQQALPQSNFRISQQFQHINIITPSQSEQFGLLPSIALIEEEKEIRQNQVTISQPNVSCSPFVDIINTRWSSCTSKKKITVHVTQSRRKKKSDKNMNKLPNNKSSEKGEQDIKLEGTQSLEEILKNQQKMIEQISNSFLANKPTIEATLSNTILPQHPEDNNIEQGEINLTLSNITSSIVQQQWEQQSESQSLQLIRTLHSKAGTIRHLRDSKNPHKLQIQEPTLMVSLNGTLTGTLTGTFNGLRCSNTSGKFTGQLISSKSSQSWVRGASAQSMLTNNDVINEVQEDEMINSGDIEKQWSKDKIAFAKKKEISGDLKHYQSYQGDFGKKQTHSDC